MSAATIKRLEAIRQKLTPDVLSVTRPKTDEECNRLTTEAKKRGERVKTIQRSYGIFGKA